MSLRTTTTILFPSSTYLLYKDKFWSKNLILIFYWLFNMMVEFASWLLVGWLWCCWKFLVVMDENVRNTVQIRKYRLCWFVRMPRVDCYYWKISFLSNYNEMVIFFYQKWKILFLSTKNSNLKIGAALVLWKYQDFIVVIEKYNCFCTDNEKSKLRVWKILFFCFLVLWEY